MSLKNPVTPPGIDPRTVQLVVQRLNHYATISSKGKILLSSPKCRRLALEPIQPPIQWVPGALSPQKNSWGVKLTTHLHPGYGGTPPFPHTLTWHEA